MKTKFHILKSSGVLTASIYDQLRVILDETDKECRQIIDLGDVDVVIMNVPWNVIPRIGINGFAYDAHQIILTLDCAHQYLIKNFEQTVKAILCHELHHSARSLARGSSHSKIYGGSLIAEGLACCFEEEIVGEVPFYATECQGKDLLNFAKKPKSRCSHREKIYLETGEVGCLEATIVLIFHTSAAIQPVMRYCVVG